MEVQQFCKAVTCQPDDAELGLLLRCFSYTKNLLAVKTQFFVSSQ